MALTEKTFKQLYDKALRRNNIINRYSKALTGQPMSNTVAYTPTQPVQAQPTQTVSNSSDPFHELYKRAERRYTLSQAQAGTKAVSNLYNQPTVAPQQTQQMPTVQEAYNNAFYNQGYFGNVNEIPGTINKDIQNTKDYLAYRAEREAKDTAKVSNNSPYANSGLSDEQIVRLENQGYTGGSHMAGKYRALPLIAAEGTVGAWVNDVEATAQLLGSKEAQDYYDFLQNTTQGANANTNTEEEVGKFYTYKDKLGKQKLDPNGKGYWILNQRDKLVADVMEDLTPKEQFLTSTAISALQNLELLGAVSIVPGLSRQRAEAVILPLMSASAAGNTIYEKSKLGKTLNDAYISGILDGTIEGATEMIGVDEWLKAFSGESGNLIKSLMIQSGAEGGEEAVGYLVNWLVEAVRERPDAKMSPQQFVSYAMSQFSPEEFITNTMSGALSGLALGGISNVSGLANMTPAERAAYINNRYSMENGVYEPTERPVVEEEIAAQPEEVQPVEEVAQSIEEAPIVEEAPVQEQPVPSETPEKIPSPLETEDAERYIKSLESTGKDNKGYRQYVSTSLERLEDALKIVDSDLYNAYLAEANSGEVSSPIIDTVINMDNVVRGDLVSPMAMARFLSRAYKAEGIEGLRNVYSRLDYTNPKVYQQILDGALPSEASNVTQTESTTSQVEKKQAKTPKAKKNPHTKSYNNALAGAKRKVKSGKHDFMSVLRDATNNYYLSVDELSDLYDDLVAYSDKNNLMVGYPRKEDVLKSHKGYKATENVAQSVEERPRRDIKFAGELRTPEEILRDRVELNQEDIEDWISEHDRTLNELEADEIDQGEWEFEKKYGMTMDTARSILNDIETERLAKEPLEGQVNFEESIKAEPKEQKPKATPKHTPKYEETGVNSKSFKNALAYAKRKAFKETYNFNELIEDASVEYHLNESEEAALRDKLLDYCRKNALYKNVRDAVDRGEGDRYGFPAKQTAVEEQSERTAPEVEETAEEEDVRTDRKRRKEAVSKAHDLARAVQDSKTDRELSENYQKLQKYVNNSEEEIYLSDDYDKMSDDDIEMYAEDGLEPVDLNGIWGVHIEDTYYPFLREIGPRETVEETEAALKSKKEKLDAYIERRNSEAASFTKRLGLTEAQSEKVENILSDPTLVKSAKVTVNQNGDVTVEYKDFADRLFFKHFDEKGNPIYSGFSKNVRTEMQYEPTDPTEYGWRYADIVQEAKAEAKPKATPKSETKPKATPKAEAEKAVRTPKAKNTKVELEPGQTIQDVSADKGGRKFEPSSAKYDSFVSDSLVGNKKGDYTQVVRTNRGYKESFLESDDLAIMLAPEYRSTSLNVEEYNDDVEGGNRYEGESPWDYYPEKLVAIPKDAMLLKDKVGVQYKVGNQLFNKNSVEKLKMVSYELQLGVNGDIRDTLVGVDRNGEMTGMVWGSPADDISTKGQSVAYGQLTEKNSYFANLSPEQEKLSTPEAVNKGELDPAEWERVDRELSAEKKRNEAAEGIVARYTMSNDALANVERLLEKAKGAKSELSDWLNETFNPSKKRTRDEKDIFFNMKGEREQTLAQLQNRVKEYKKMFDSFSNEENKTFIDNYQNGRPQATPELQKADEFIRKWIEPLTEGLLEIDPDASLRENYLPQIWRETGKKLERATALMRKRGLVGDTSFRKQRVYDTYVEGINAGLTPLTLNPMELLEHIVAAETQYITAHKMFNAYKDMGAIRFVPLTKAIPDGYKRIDDKLFKVYYMTDIKKLGQIGQYVATEGVADMLNNWTMANDVRNSTIGSSLSDAKNVLTRWELNLSGFHWIQTGMTALQEAIGISRQNLVNNKDLSSLSGLINPVGKARKTRQIGQQLMSLALDEDSFMSDPQNVKWLNEHPRAKEIVELWWQGGGKLSNNEFEEMGKNMHRGLNGILKDFADTKDVSDVFRNGYNTIQAASNALTNPLFDTVIPSLKMGYFFEQMSHDMQVYADDIASGKKSLTELARSNIDTMDDLFGAMNYDNRNWNRNVKQILQIVFRSPTWWYGNVHMGRGILKENVDNAKALLSKNQRMVLGKNTGFAVGLVYMSAVVGSIMHFMMTGRRPEDWKDMIAPWTGEYDRNGEKVRVSAPGYIKSWINMYTNPMSSVTSATSGFFDLSFRLRKNQDFYGNYIRDPADPALKQATQVLDYIWKEVGLPFTISNAVEDYNKSKDDEGNVDWGNYLKLFAGDMAGLSKAPNIITTSKFKRDIAKAYEEESGFSSKPGSPNDADKRDERTKIRQKIFDGTATDEEVQKAVRDGIITVASARNAKQYTYAYQWSLLSPDTRTKLWDEASADEKQILAAIELKKKPEDQNSGFLKDWKSGKLKMPGQDTYSKSKLYSNSTFEQTRSALQFYYQYKTNKDTATYQDKDMSDTYKSVNRLCDAGYSLYDACMIRTVLKDVEGTKDKNGKTVALSRRNNRITALIKMGYSQKEAEKMVLTYEGK